MKLHDFVKAAFASVGHLFDITSQPADVQQLLKSVGLRLRDHAVRPAAATAAQPDRAEIISLGSCQHSLLEILRQARLGVGTSRSSALDVDQAIEALSTNPWQLLHRLLGDHWFWKLLSRHYIILAPNDEVNHRASHRLSRLPVPSTASRIEHFHPSLELVPRHRILHEPSFGKGLPIRNPLNCPATLESSQKLASWLLSQHLFQAAPKHVNEYVGKDTTRSKRKRGKRRAGTGRNTTASETRVLPEAVSSARCAFPCKFDKTLLAILQASQEVDFQKLLSWHCPSEQAISEIAAFERQNPHLPARELMQNSRQTVFGLHCRCSRKRSDFPALPKGYACSGGSAELHFMRNFPALRCAIPMCKVASFLTASLEAVVGGAASGANLLGSKKNWLRLMEAARCLVHLRRGETVSAHDAIQGMSLKAFQHSMQRRAAQAAGKALAADLLGRLCYFMLAHVAVPLLRTHFYATEAEPSGTRLVFFRKNVWYLLRSRAECGYLHLCLDVSGEMKEAEEHRGRRHKRKRTSGKSTDAPAVRWVPKKQGLRPLANFAKTSSAKRLRSHRHTLRVLSHLRASHPEVLGRSMLSQAEVHHRLASSLRELRKRDASTPESRKQLFVAVADLTNCYEQIEHGPLLESLGALPLARTYTVAQVVVQRGALATQKAEVAFTRADGKLQDFLASRRCPPALQNRHVLMQCGHASLERSSVLQTLRAAVNSCYVVLRTQRKGGTQGAGKVLIRGVPQGSRFSSFLCALHMARGDDKEEAMLKEENGEGFLLRLVDDFLVVSSGSPAGANRFLTALTRPDNSYGGEVNIRKLAANFPVHSCGKSKAVVPWAGMTLAPVDDVLNVSWQSRGACVADSLALTRRQLPRIHRFGSKRPWQAAIDAKLLRFLDTKLAPLLLDPTLSSLGCLQANVARVCGVCGLRLVWLVLRRRGMPGGDAKAVAGAVLRLARRAALRTRSSLASLRGPASETLNALQTGALAISLEAFQSALWPRRHHPLLFEACRALGEARAQEARKLAK